MVKKIQYLLLLGAAFFVFQGCAHHLVKNATLVKGQAPAANIDLSKGKQVEGKTYYPYMIGYDFEDSIDKAFAAAGKDFDILVNTTIDVKYYFALIYYSKYVIVKGTAVNSSALKTSMGEEKYKQWLAGQNVIYRGQ